MRNRACGQVIMALVIPALGCVSTPVDPSEWATDAGGLAVGGAGGATSTVATGGTPVATAGPTSSGGGGGGGTSASAPASTGGATGAACDAPAVKWQTSTVSLQADAFWIVANGQCYTSRGVAVQVHSDPGGSQYTTLELVWTELGRQMRFFIYLYADSSSWWSDEMRTYDGQQPYSDWLMYHGQFFTSPIGQPFHGHIDLTNDPQDAIRGELHLHGLTVSTTMTGK
jgi:hypothetical protein